MLTLCFERQSAESYPFKDNLGCGFVCVGREATARVTEYPLVVDSCTSCVGAVYVWQPQAQSSLCLVASVKVLQLGS